MYFSKNSRYVLQKAQLLSPTIFRGTERKLGVKKPKDDPTKPSLRVNIPDDTDTGTSYPKLHSPEPRSRSLVSKSSSFNSSLEDDLVAKSESEVHFSKLDDILVQSSFESGTTPKNDAKTDFVGDTSTEDYNAGFYGDQRIGCTESVKNVAAEGQNDSQTLYIIIDVPQKNESGRDVVEDLDGVSNVRKTQSNLEHTPDRIVAKPRQRFEVHEVEDAATYIFHLRFNKNLRKPSGVGCVPEKEISTRNELINYKDAPIKVKGLPGLPKKVAAVDELPEFVKIAEGKRQKLESLMKKTKAVPEPAPEPEPEDGQKKNVQEVVNQIKEEKKYLKKFERDDFGGVRIAGKNYPFKMPGKNMESVEQEVAEGAAATPEEGWTINNAVKVQSSAPVQEQSIPAEVNAASTQPSAVAEHQQQSSEESKGYLAKTQKSTPDTQNESQTAIRYSIPSRKYKNRRKSDLEYYSIHENTEEAQKDQKTTKDDAITDEKYLYYSIHQKEPETKSLEKSKKKENPKSRSKSLSKSKKVSSTSDTDMSDFQTSTAFVNIRSEKCLNHPMTFGAAFPPLLREALNSRLKFRKDLFSDRWTKPDPKLRATELSENSILFPKEEPEKFDCESLFSSREEVILNIIKNSEEENKKHTAMTQEAKPSVDSLTVMKKVKEIVQFDLENAVKIFSGDEDGAKELSSVVVLRDEKWEVDNAELEEQIKMRKNEFGIASKLLPSKKQTNPDCSDSVVWLNPDTNEFIINKEALADAINRRTNEPWCEINKCLSFIASEAKTGDSILVFDEGTQSWRVDYSILEKREHQLHLEEELTKRSELILDAFEKLERNQKTPEFPKPVSKDKKTFDYKRKQWKVYDPEKEKSRYKLNEPNAEEIRQQNSEMYNDLFVTGKKEASTSKGSSKIPRKLEKKAAESSKDSESSPKAPEPLAPETPVPPPERKKPEKEDDNYWGTFLRMNILPRDISEIPKISPSQPSPQPADLPPPKTPVTPKPTPLPPKTPVTPKPTPSTNPPPPLPETPPPPLPKPTTPSPSTPTTPKAEEPKVSEKKIEEPRFRIHLPFIRDKKIDKGKPKKVPVSKGEPKTDKKPPTGVVDKKEEPAIKAPPPPSQTPKEDPKPKEPTQKLGTNQPEKKAMSPYVSDKIIEISRNTPKEPQIKANKLETVKLNITADKRLPSRITEINLNKKMEEKVKQPNKVRPEEDGKTQQSTMHKNLEKYKTPYSEPDYEEKSLKIKSDLESNPNLKKLDTWNKTLVLHDIMKPPDNIESWLKDETDKMATLLLKILQEASTDVKPKKKSPMTKTKINEKPKGNPYESIRKKKEVTPENFLFRVRTVNLTLENDRKIKPNAPPGKDIPVQKGKTEKQEVFDIVKIPGKTSGDVTQFPVHNEKPKMILDNGIIPREQPGHKFPVEITDDIPGPEILKRISNAWKLFPVLGTQMTVFTLMRLYQLVRLGSSTSERNAFARLFNKYGPIVNVQSPLSGNVVLVHKSEHLLSVFEQDATVPTRSVFDSLEQSRITSEEKSFSNGVSTDWSKPEWNELKRGTIDPLMRGSEKYFESADSASEFLVKNVRRNRNAQNLVSEDFMEDIRRWSLEGMCNVLFEKSFGFLEGRTSSMSWIMEPDKLNMGMEEATTYLTKCERGFQAWRLMTTPSLVGLGEAYRSMSTILSKQLYQAEINLKNKNELVKNGRSFPGRDLSFIESMLLNDGMNNEEITCNLIDVLLIGTNSMSSALGFLLYNLAQNVKAQNKLYKELREVLPNKNARLDYNSLSSLKYLQACLKENLRLHMPVPVFYRLLQNDILLANYVIPKGTFVVMDYRMSCLKEQIFDDPHKFIPERWMSEEKWMEDAHPFASLPFCQGPRGELAKKITEMQLCTCVAKIVRNFQVEYHYGEIQEVEGLIATPDKPLKLSFVERDL